MSSTQPGQNPTKRPKSRAKTRLPQIPEWPPVLDQDTPDWLRRLVAYKSKLTNDETLLTWAKRAAWATGETRYDVLAVMVLTLIRHGQRLLEAEQELDFVEVFTHDQVEQTVARTFTKLSRESRSLAVSALRRIGPALNPFGGYQVKSAISIQRVPSPRPYTDAEQDELLRKAQALPSARRRTEVTAVVCLTAGAGATPSELLGLTWADITVSDTATRVFLSGRTIPVLSRYAAVLAGLRQAAQPPVTVLVNQREHAVSGLTNYARENGMPNWSANRAMHTWRAFQLGRVPPPVVLRGAGISAGALEALLMWLPAAEGGLELLADGAK